MIYEILVRPSYNKRMTSDHLIWIESDLPTRSFERWLTENSLLEKSTRSPLVRWSIIQTKRAAHFILASQQEALKNRISELMSGATHLQDMPEAQEMQGSLTLPLPNRAMEMSAA
jgi:hypothetical protein